MTALPASGGVRSLLAKFENTNNNSSSNNVADASSPSRGRSSGESNDNATNRPLSKVRANFVPVERNGQGSPTPGMLRRTESYGTEVDSSQRSATMSPAEKSLASPFSPSPQKIRTALAAFQGDPVKSVNEKLASLAVKDEDSPQPSTASKKSETIKEPSTVAAVDKPSNKPEHGTPRKQPSSMTIKKSASTMSIPKEPSTSKTTVNKTTAKEKKAAVTPTRSATTTTRPTAHTDKPTTKRTTAGGSAAPAARTDRAKTPAQDTAKKPTMQPSPQSKPAPKSPTRPVRLSASLVTPTAASAARTGSLARSQSHINLRSSPKTETAKTLSRKPSTLRPDAARLTTHSIPDRPRSRVSTTSSRAPQEESFLARMMRPTASSASKMHEKIEPRSPPRLAKAARVTPKKEPPVKVAEGKGEKHGRSPREDSSPSAAVKVQVEQPAIRKNPVEEAVTNTANENIEKPAATESAPGSDVENSKLDPHVPLEQPLPESHELEVVPEVEAEPASKSPDLDAEPQVPEVAPEPLPELAVAEVKSENVPSQSPLVNSVDQTDEKGLSSVPETAPEEHEDNTPEAAPEPDPQREAKADVTKEPAKEVPPQEEEPAQRPVEEAKDEEVKPTEPAQPQPSEESIPSVPDSSEEAPAETSFEKAEQSQVEFSSDKEI